LLDLPTEAPALTTVRGLRLEGDRFEFMVGAAPTRDMHPVFTRWQSTSVGISAGK
jgi:hypothetical protein